MSEETTITPKPAAQDAQETGTPWPELPNESHVMNVSLRGWIVVILVGTLCYLAASEKIDPTNFMSYAFGVISAYFVQNIKPKSQAP